MLPLMVFLLIGCKFYLGIIWKFHQDMEHLQITLNLIFILIQILLYEATLIP